MTPTHHIMVIWENGRVHERDILRLLEADGDVDVLREFDVSWRPEVFPLALGQLYGERLPSRGEKVRHCGDGTFLVLVLRDHDPRPGTRRTPRGIERVDTHIFDIKQAARRLSGGGHLVHATDSDEEFRRDLVVLTGINPARVAEFVPEPRRSLDWVPPGADGWDGVEEMLVSLGRRTDYCVLRNFESWDHGGPTDDHPDIDLLVASLPAAEAALAAVPTSGRRGRAQFVVSLAGRPVNIDLRTPADGYMPTELAARVLDRARPHPKGFMVPSAEDHFDALAYHALVHRDAVSDDYRARLVELAADLGRDEPQLADADEQRTLLASIVDDAPLPRDPSVRYNHALLGRPAGLRRREMTQRLRSLGGNALRRVGLAA